MTRTTKQAHTPGPWKIKDVPDGIYGDQPCLLIKGFFTPTATKESIIAIVEYMRGFPQEQAERANARLIAAAPELLDALKRAATFIGEAIIDNELSDDLIPLHNDMMAAIAQAEGR